MTSLHQLTLPSNINIDDDSFSKDLIRQFDKRRSKLHFELGLVSKEPSPEPSIRNISRNQRDYSNIEPIPLDQEEEEDSQIRVDQEEEEDNQIRVDQEEDGDSQKRTSYTSKRSSSASDLFKRSSAYLISKLNPNKKKNKSQERLVNKQTKLLMKTTITVPATTSSHPHLDISSPIPTITQYPPKPLVYSPVEPIPEPLEDKPLLHRISMPLLRVYHDSHSITRHRSIASLVTRRRKSEPNQPKRKK